ncbi:MAG: cystathionine gamma-synthase [Geobacteraceae bacterium]|nr:cystathionine gamma-synthase [Geobacteraceae bacterium]
MPPIRDLLSIGARPRDRERCSLSTLELTKKLLEGIRLAAFAVSLGGVESIVSYPAKMSHAAMPPQERALRGISDTLIRLSVGLEDTEDLIADLDRVLNG